MAETHSARPILRRARAGEGPQLRALRLRALGHAGEAFLETLADAAALDASDWETRLGRYIVDGRQVLMVAEDPGDRSWVAMAGAFIDSERYSDEFDLPDPPVAEEDRWVMVWGTYVDPAVRGQGVGDALCAELCRWVAEEAGVDWLGLHVRDSSTPAIGLYRRHGFRVVACTSHPELGVTALVMVRSVTS